MTAGREAIGLPAIFLTAALLGGLRVAETVRLVPPPLVALVLAVLLLGALARGGVLAPDRLMNAGRTPLENASGAVVLFSLFAASAQIFNLVMPERGLLHALFGICLFVQLATALAGVTGRVNLLRSLVVLFGSAFVIRFVILESLYAPDSGVVKRLLTTLMEGASLGTIEYQPTSAATGYVGFFTLALYMVGLVLLPSPARRGRSNVRALSRNPRAELALVLLVAMATAGGCGPHASADAPPTDAARFAAREQALRSARVWEPPIVPISQVDFGQNPPGPNTLRADVDLSCRFVVQQPNGTTPKFYCELPDGRILKVKYGTANPEPRAEVAATRLLDALGFGADRMYVVRTLRCAGCPLAPFRALKCYARTGLASLCFAGGLDYADVTTFEHAVVEQRMAGTVIEAVEDQGWAWFELDRIDPTSGGSPRADVDALRLLAVILGHWDNKAPNQRIVCPPGRELGGGGCARARAIVQDLGATFGPLKLDLPNWRRTPVWTDRATCTVSMKTMPFGGATFVDRRISEEGRLKLGGLLEQMSEAQLAVLFTESGIASFDQIAAEGKDAGAWVRTFRDKVRQIKDAGPCPERAPSPSFGLSRNLPGVNRLSRPADRLEVQRVP